MRCVDLRQNRAPKQNCWKIYNCCFKSFLLLILGLTKTKKIYLMWNFVKFPENCEDLFVTFFHKIAQLEMSKMVKVTCTVIQTLHCKKKYVVYQKIVVSYILINDTEKKYFHLSFVLPQFYDYCWFYGIRYRLLTPIYLHIKQIFLFIIYLMLSELVTITKKNLLNQSYLS